MALLDAPGGSGLDARIKALDAWGARGGPPPPAACISGNVSYLDIGSSSTGLKLVPQNDPPNTPPAAGGQNRYVFCDETSDTSTTLPRLFRKKRIDFGGMSKPGIGDNAIGTLRQVTAGLTEDLRLSIPGWETGDDFWLLEDTGVVVTDNDSNTWNLHRLININGTFNPTGVGSTALRMYYGAYSETGLSGHADWDFDTYAPWSSATDTCQIDEPVSDACRLAIDTEVMLTGGTGGSNEDLIGGGTVDLSGHNIVTVYNTNPDGLAPIAIGNTRTGETFVEPDGLEDPVVSATRKWKADPHAANTYWTRGGTSSKKWSIATTDNTLNWVSRRIVIWARVDGDLSTRPD